MKKILASLLVSLCCLSSAAWAKGEVVKLDTHGTHFCKNKAPLTLDPTNSMPFWARFDTTQITVFADAQLTQPAFVLTASLAALPADNGVTRKALDAVFYSDASNYLIVNGIVKFDKKGMVTFANTNFIRRGLFDACSSSGQFIGKRVK